MHFVYILRSLKTGNFYIGYTQNLNKRLKYHNLGLNRSTKNKGPWILVYNEVLNSKSAALKREKFLKRQRNKKFYEKLIRGVAQ
jgi:putative endonuclease